LRRQVDVRSFFLGLDDIHIALAIRQRHVGHVRQKTAQNNVYVWQGFQCSQVRFLAHPFVGVAGTRIHQRGEVIDSLDLVEREQDTAKGGKIQPLVRCAFDCAVIEVESVNVNVSEHGLTLKTETAVRRSRAGFANYYRGVASIIVKCAEMSSGLLEARPASRQDWLMRLREHKSRWFEILFYPSDKPCKGCGLSLT